MSVNVLCYGAELRNFLANVNNKTGSSIKASRFFAAIFLIPVLLLGTSAGATAAEGDWTVKRVSGVVYFVAPGVEAFRAHRGMVFEKGYTLGTRAGARALIARGNETISVGPNTTFAISKYRSQGVKTTLLQRKGTIDVDVQKRGQPHFTVETPFFAAVVKGTRFEVSVRNKRAKVSVQRGMVEVEDFASGERADLRAGQSASSEPARKVGLSVGGKTKPTVRQGAKRAPAFATPAVKNVPASASAANSANAASNNGIFGGNGIFGSNSNNGNGNSGNNGNGNGDSGNNGNGNGNNGNGNGNSSDNGNGNGNSGNNGNGNGNSSDNGNGNGNSGNNGNGNGNSGNNGNGNGNSGNNGNGNGNGKN